MEQKTGKVLTKISSFNNILLNIAIHSNLICYLKAIYPKSAKKFQPINRLRPNFRIFFQADKTSLFKRKFTTEYETKKK